MNFYHFLLKSIDRHLQSDTILVMKKKEITLEYIAEKLNVLDSVALDIQVLKENVSKLQEDVALIRLDTTQLRKDVDRHYHEFLDTQDDVQKILEIAKGDDDRLGFWQIATAR